MIKGKDIIVHGLQSLDSPIGSNCVNLAYEFAKNNRVLYVNYPLDRLTSIRHRSDDLVKKRLNIIKGKENGLVRINDSMWNLFPDVILESINQITYRPLFTFLNNLNNKKYAKSVAQTIRKLEFKDYIIFNDSDFTRALNFKDILKPKVSVYYTRDNMRATDYFRKHGARFEDALMQKSDLVVANSVYLQKIAKKVNPHSYYVGQGCDLTLFNPNTVKEIPSELNDIKVPIIGYIGALKSSRLDIKTITYIAKAKPDWSIVLIGPEDEQFKHSDLHHLKNVHFMGPKPIDQLPNYLLSFDVAFNPQAVNPLTIGNYPRKIDEYLAMGKAVIATKTETMEVFKDYCYLASGNEEYVQLIEKAIVENSKEKAEARINFAKSHSWENNVNEIYKSILKVAPNI
ncbi:MAG: glycosyl transferase family 1 [Bacteroidetes bacterium HGW-Bacteroidetes-17]|jgi:glycosyltransferase involved in cell wall biosynthesis|nr:MAG: glycosyl transferase family 1 [Bacteroidetes bacterium HGW-Bacteroidetes-17]